MTEDDRNNNDGGDYDYDEDWDDDCKMLRNNTVISPLSILSDFAPLAVDCSVSACDRRRRSRPANLLRPFPRCRQRRLDRHRRPRRRHTPTSLCRLLDCQIGGTQSG